EIAAYDKVGNLTGLTDFNGKTTAYSYDSLNRLKTLTPDASLGQPVVAFTYTSTGQRATMADASGSTTYNYDTRDRLLSKATPQGTLSYSYDLASNVLTLRSSNANGVSVDYSYDNVNRLATVVDNRLASGANTTTYSYDAANNLTGYSLPNGVQTIATYNPL